MMLLQSLAARIQLAKMNREEGQTLIEYALIVSLISVVAIIALKATGTSVKGMLNHVSNSV